MLQVRYPPVGQRLSVFMPFACSKSSATTPCLPPQGIPIMCNRRTSEDGNCPHSHHALLWYFFSEVLFVLRSLTSLPTDTSVFLVVVALAAKSGLKGYKMPRILRIIVQDATIYFLVIFTSHFVFWMTLLLARVSTPTISNGSDAETSPDKSTTLTSYVSALFETHREKCSPFPRLTLVLSGNFVCVSMI